MMLKTLYKALFLLLIFTIAFQFQSVAQQGRPISEFLDEHGEFQNPEGYSGTVDFTGYEMVTDSSALPVFEKVETASAPDDNWYALGSGLNGSPRALAVVGDDLYVGGGFTTAGGISSSRIARYDMTAATWHALGSGTDLEVRTFAISGDDLYVGGRFTLAGGNSANRVARYDMIAGTWHPLGSGVNDAVNTLTMLGDNLYVGGEFTTAGGSSANYVARYEVSTGTWHALGSGVTNVVSTLLAVEDDLYIGGFFTAAGGISANRIARYNMTSGSWHAVGSGVNDAVKALVLVNDDLYVGGEFTTAGGNSANRVARYDINAGAWHAVGSGLNHDVNSIIVAEDDLYIGGFFTSAGGISANRVVRYDMNAGTWHAFGSGVNGGVWPVALSGNDLYVGGSFTSAGGNSAVRIARWSPPVTYTVSIPGPNEGWHMLGAPISGVTYGTLLNGIWTQGFTGSEYESGMTNVLWYEEGDRSTLWKTPGNASNIIGGGQDSGLDNLGTGFFAYVYADDDYDSDSDGWPKELSVTGVAPSSDITKSLSYTTSPSDGYTGWHPLSNPYPFTIDWSEVVADASTTDINSTIYVWDPNRSGGADYLVSGSGGDYDGMIAPFQGFWVQATSGSAQVNFSPNHQASSESDYVKQKSEQLLTLQLENGEKSTWTSLVFDDEKAEQPQMYNAARMGSLSHEFVHLYTADGEGNPLIIQHLPQKGEQHIEVPLEISTTKSGTFHLSTKQWTVPPDISIELRDQETGESFKLSENTEYPITIEPSEVAKSSVENSALALTSSLLAAKTNLNESRFSLRIHYGSVDEVTNIPTEFSLSQNYPNPFNPSTVISYQLPVNSEVQLKVFDLTGRQVATLVDGQVEAGTHQVSFDGSGLSSGVYMYRLVAGRERITRKLTLIK